MILTGLVDRESFWNSITDLDKIVVNKFNGEYMEKYEYYNVPCSFDIETSSFRDNQNNKRACMYIWQFGINGYVTIGRTWDEFEDFMKELEIRLDLNDHRLLVCYVHNLAYEYQWIKDRFNWVNIFAREKRKPMKAVTENGFEFRCSYILSGCSLEQTAKDLTKYKVEKKVGDLDYRQLRSPLTNLSKAELDYAVYDVLCVMAFIQEEIESAGDISKITMTKTGKVRKYCREHCFNKENKKNFTAAMSDLTIGSKDEYNLLKRAFQGGFTHTNHNNCMETFEDVQSMDFTSSYPAVMIAFKMPMTKGEWIKVKDIKQIEFLEKFNNYLIFNIEFTNIREKENIPDHYISVSKCKGLEDWKSDNGRIVRAKKLQTTITSDDWYIIDKVYDYDEIRIGKCLKYGCTYLPKAFIECVLDFYSSKTTLKNVNGMESEYQLKKGLLNSCFGCSVTDICPDSVFFEDWHEDSDGFEVQWDDKKADIDKCIYDYNNSKNRFLYYPWGIAICSKARRNLWSGILELGEDYIYSDTDSVKYINPDKHTKYFEDYNKDICKKMEKALKFHGIDVNAYKPKTVDGEEKPLGVWDFDGRYKKFKALGAKRYLVEKQNGKIECTIAGANKKMASAYIAEQKDPFEFFSNEMSIDKEHAGRLVHTYLDKPFICDIIDIEGNNWTVKELSGIHMEESEYNLSLSDTYLDYLLGNTYNIMEGI